MKRVLAVATSALVLAAGAAGVLYARAIEPVYSTVYYSDASKTEVVGFTTEMCLPGDVVAGPLSGIQTPYFDAELIYYCDTETGFISE